MKSRTRRQRVEAAIAAIRNFHDVGMKPPTGTVSEDAKRHRLNYDTLLKARQFASEKEGFSKSELEALCHTIQHDQDRLEKDTNEGHREINERAPVFGRTHIIWLLRAKPKAVRREIQKRAVTEHWSLNRLEAEIAKRCGPRRAGGRRPMMPTSVPDVYAHVEKMCEGWRRWFRALRSKPTPDGAKRTRNDRISPSIERLIQAATDVIQRLQVGVTKELESRFPDRGVRLRQTDRPDR
jgi:hypothetical protein